MAGSPVTCDHPGCAAEPTHERVVWVTPGCVKLELWCADHAPADAAPIEEDYEDDA